MLVAVLILVPPAAAITLGSGAGGHSAVDEGGQVWPPRAGAAKTVIADVQVGAERYSIKTSWASRSHPDGTRELCVAAVGSDGAMSEMCGPADGRLVYTMDETFVAPETQEPLESPQRLVYGFVDRRADIVRVQAPNGIEVADMRLAYVPNAPLKVFAGAAPTIDERGTGAITALDRSDPSVPVESVGAEEVRFHDLAVGSEAPKTAAKRPH